MLAWWLHPDDLLLRRAQRDPLLQDPFLTAVQGEGELQPPHQDRPNKEGERGGCSCSRDCRAGGRCGEGSAATRCNIEQRLGEKERKETEPNLYKKSPLFSDSNLQYFLPCPHFCSASETVHFVKLELYHFLTCHLDMKLLACTVKTYCLPLHE